MSARGGLSVLAHGGWRWQQGLPRSGLQVVTPGLCESVRPILWTARQSTLRGGAPHPGGRQLSVVTQNRPMKFP